jgi:hypothetical protein
MVYSGVDHGGRRGGGESGGGGEVGTVGWGGKVEESVTIMWMGAVMETMRWVAVGRTLHRFLETSP